MSASPTVPLPKVGQTHSPALAAVALAFLLLPSRPPGTRTGRTTPCDSEGVHVKTMASPHVALIGGNFWPVVQGLTSIVLRGCEGTGSAAAAGETSEQTAQTAAAAARTRAAEGRGCGCCCC